MDIFKKGRAISKKEPYRRDKVLTFHPLTFTNVKDTQYQG
jgi:alkyl hydroperoxide reductase subunit AhpC